MFTNVPGAVPAMLPANTTQQNIASMMQQAMFSRLSASTPEAQAGAEVTKALAKQVTIHTFETAMDAIQKIASVRAGMEASSPEAQATDRLLSALVAKMEH